MSERSGYIPMPELFAGQFTPDGDGFIYRKSSIGEAKKITSGERDGFVATFIYRRQYLVAAAMIGVVLLVVGVGIHASYNSVDEETLVGIVVLIGFFETAHWIIWRAPARALRARPAVAQALPVEEARRVRLSRVRYGRLVWLVIVGAWIRQVMSEKRGDWAGWDALGYAVLAACVLFAAVQAFRKWRIERSGQNSAITSKNATP